MELLERGENHGENLPEPDPLGDVVRRSGNRRTLYAKQAATKASNATTSGVMEK